jgi:hypothetical protein
MVCLYRRLAFKLQLGIGDHKFWVLTENDTAECGHPDMDDSIGEVNDGGVLFFGGSLFRVVGSLFKGFGCMKVGCVLL